MHGGLELPFGRQNREIRHPGSDPSVAAITTPAKHRMPTACVRGGEGLCADKLPRRSLAIMPDRDDCSNKGRGDKQSPALAPSLGLMRLPQKKVSLGGVGVGLQGRQIRWKLAMARAVDQETEKEFCSLHRGQTPGIQGKGPGIYEVRRQLI